MTDHDPHEFPTGALWPDNAVPAVDDSAPMSPPPPPATRGRRIAPWMWITPAVLVIAVAAFFGGRAAASTGSSAGQPLPVAAQVTTPSTSASSTPARGARKAGKKGTPTIGEIKSVAGDTWTVQKADGSTVTVTIDSETQFGTKAKPETAAEFTAGTKVLVMSTAGSTDQSSVTATRVISRVKAAAKSSAPAAATSQTTTTA